MESRRPADHALKAKIMRTLLALSLATPVLATLVLAGPARAQVPPPAAFTVALAPLADEKAVFATVESRNVVPARARIGGTVLELAVDDGDEVTEGQRIAVIGDDKLRLQLRALEAQIAGLTSQLEQARADFARMGALSRNGAVSRQEMEQARTAVDVAASTLDSRIAERGVVQQQIEDGAVRAPTAGRVLVVPLTAGSVVLPGEPVAQIAQGDFVLRLSLPERHAAFVHVGDKVRLDDADLGIGKLTYATVSLVYPRIDDGRVKADATAPGLGGYFVGQRVRVWVSAGTRQAIVVPARMIMTRFGLNFARRRGADGTMDDIPVQRGRDTPSPAMPDGVEILSGLVAGDALVAP